MIRKRLLCFGLAAVMAASSSLPAFAAVNTSLSSTSMENCGAYLFEWRPIDCGNGNYFAILVGGNTITESNVILNRGYDYAYTFDPMTYARPWGTVPDLVNTDGVWAIPENWRSLPEGTQPVLQIILKTNNKNLDTDKRYINVVHLPNGTDTSSLPPEVRKYLINVDGSDAGAYNGTVTPGWQTEADGSKKYLKPDGTYITNGWLTLEDEQYYMDERGVMLKDTVTPDGHYVTPEGKRVSYMPGWFQDTDGWRYIQKNGYYLANSWFQDTDGKYYYFNMAALMAVNTDTPDGYHVDENGVWDGNASTVVKETVNLGPGVATGWEPVDIGWKFRQSDGSYLTNSWKQDPDGKWYYLNEDGWMLKDTTTPDGFYVDENGVWQQDAAVPETAE